MKILEGQAAELLALPEAKAVEKALDADEEIPEDDLKAFLEAWGRNGLHDRMGDMEGFSNWITSAKCDRDGDGNVNERELAAQKEEAQGKIDAAANFMMNVNIVTALLVTIQLGLVLTEAEMHPMMSAALNKLEETLHIGLTWYYDSAYYSKGSVTEEAVEVHVLTYVAQHLATIWMLFSIRQGLSLIVKTSKAYGHIMYWAADVETKLWYCQSGQVMWVQGYINGAGRDFLMSLVPYVCLTRGPIIAAVFFYTGMWIGKDFGIFNGTGAAMLLVHQSRRVKSGMLSAAK